MEDYIIIGAGLSGLSAAITLQSAGKKVKILEAESEVGGRMRTTQLNGYLLDHGFQVYLDAYPEGKNLLDYSKLNLRPFDPSAIILGDQGWDYITDPIRRPQDILKVLFSSTGTLLEKARTYFLKQQLESKTIEQIFRSKEQTTDSYLTEKGFNLLLSEFLRPFFSGIFLEDKLATSSRMFEFVYKMMSEGNAVLPASGMGAIPKQLANRLAPGSLALNAMVQKVIGQKVLLEDDVELEGHTIIFANSRVGLYGSDQNLSYRNGHTVNCLYFSANDAPFKQKCVAINSSKKKLISNLAVLTNIAPSYAPEGKHLISVSINGKTGLNEETLILKVRQELFKWLGDQVDKWDFLKCFRIDNALPNQDSVSNETELSAMKLSDNHYQCGDFQLNGSINAALKSGRLLAEALLDR